MLAIVTDSTAGLSAAEARQMGVRVVPMSYRLGEYPYVEGYRGQNSGYSRLLDLGAPANTFQPPVASYVSTFEELLRKGFDVLCLTISSRLSGAYRSASAAARELHSDRVLVVDSLSTAGGLAMLVQKARSLANEGLTLAQVGLMLEDLRRETGIVFSVEQMGALRRSRRLGVVRQSMGTVLNLRPVLTLQNGAVVSHTLARGKGEQMNALLRALPAAPKQLALIHFGPDSDLAAYQRRLRSLYPQAKIVCRDGGPVLGIHLGAGTLGVSWATFD